METTAENNGQKKKLALKITRKMQTDKTGVIGADPAENKTPSYSAEVELKGMKWTLAIYSCSIMQCKLCLPRETELAAYTYIDINPSQACRDKVNTYIIALVVKMKLWRFSKRFCTIEPKRQWCRVCNIVCDNIVIVVLTMCDLTLSVFCQKPNKSH